MISTWFYKQMNLAPQHYTQRSGKTEWPSWWEIGGIFFSSMMQQWYSSRCACFAFQNFAALWPYRCWHGCHSWKREASRAFQRNVCLQKLLTHLVECSRCIWRAGGYNTWNWGAVKVYSMRQVFWRMTSGQVGHGEWCLIIMVSEWMILKFAFI